MSGGDKIISVIDFGSSKITTLVASHLLADDRLNIIGLSSVPSKGFKRGQITNIEAVIKSLDQSVGLTERMAGVNVGSAYVGVGTANLFSKNSHGVVAVADPNGEIRSSDVERVIDAARAVTIPPSYEVIHVLPRDYIVDGQNGIRDPQSMMGIRLEVETHIVIESLPNIRNILKSLKEVGIECDRIVFSGLASSLAVLTETEMDLGVVMLDIGAGKTSLAVWVDGSLAHSAVLPVGAQHVTKDVALGLRVSLESAEKIKCFISDKMASMDEETRKKEMYKDEIDVGSLNLPENLPRISKKTLIEGIIKPRLTEIFGLAGAEIEKAGFLNMTPAGIVLTGGGALTVGAVEVARHRTTLATRIGVPQTLGGLSEEVAGPAFATAVGLLKFATQEKAAAKTSGAFEFIKKIPAKNLLGKIGKVFKNFLP